MISVFCLPFDDLTKHALSAKLPITQGRREWGNALSLPSLVSSLNDPEYGVYASIQYQTYHAHCGVLQPTGDVTEVMRGLLA